MSEREMETRNDIHKMGICITCIFSGWMGNRRANSLLSFVSEIDHRIQFVNIFIILTYIFLGNEYFMWAFIKIYLKCALNALAWFWKIYTDKWLNKLLILDEGCWFEYILSNGSNSHWDGEQSELADNVVLALLGDWIYRKRKCPFDSNKAYINTTHLHQ